MEARSTTLGPELIGRRLTLRLHAADGGYRDLVGTLESMTTICRRDGEIVTFNPDEIAIVHPIPEVDPRAGKGAPLSIRIAELENLSTQTWPPLEIKTLGNWKCRISNGETFRANSVLVTGAPPFGDPGLNIEDAISAVETIYAEAGLPAVIQVCLPIYQELNNYLVSRGWSEKVAAAFLIKDLEASPHVDEIAKNKNIAISIEDSPTDEFLTIHKDQGVRSIMNAYPARYVALSQNGELIATARVAVLQSWAIVTRLIVVEAHRKKGLARLLMLACMNSAMQDGATKMCLQVDQSNRDAQALYENLGFRIHHTYRFIQRAESNACAC
jgi:GNAT superfamily N-acetyltransferase